MSTPGKRLAIAGSILQIGQVFGLVGTCVGMIMAFQTIGAGGEGKPEVLAHDIGIALVSTAVGLIASGIGLILMLIAMFGPKYRAPWFFWVFTVYCVLWVLNFPIGTILGIGPLVYVIRHRGEFRKVLQEPLPVCSES